MDFFKLKSQAVIFIRFAHVKKLLILLLAVSILSACNRAVCPAYNDSANNISNTISQKGSYRANGITKFYRDSYQKKLR